jgi:hypothetical protein
MPPPHVSHQTLLADGGCILGATMPHVVVDGESMYSVLEAIAAAYCTLACYPAGGTAPSPLPPPLHDRSAFLRAAPQHVPAWEPDPYFGTLSPLTAPKPN